MVSIVLEWRRQNKGYFSGVTSFTDRLAIDMTSNLVRAAISDIPYNEIGKRLYDALEKKEEIKKQIYNKADDIIRAYRKRCMELGIFDFGMAVELYNNYLITDSTYQKQLFNRIDHLIVDNIEECVPDRGGFYKFSFAGFKNLLNGLQP